MDTSSGVERIVTELGLTVSGVPPSGSASGSHVLPVITGDGTEAILKITIGDGGANWDASVRELGFYREISGDLGVHTPRLLDHQLTEDSIALVITRHPPPRPAVGWAHDHWLLLADDLATIHRQPVEPRPPQPLPANPSKKATEFWNGSAEVIADLLDRPAELHRRATTLDTAFVHGDCHADNISVTDDGLIWLDWQGSGPGNPAGDLAFPSVRARPSDAVVPLEAMAKRYADHRGLQPSAVLDAVLASELLVLLFQWPDYAQFNTDEGNQRVRDRAAHLSGALVGRHG